MSKTLIFMKNLLLIGAIAFFISLINTFSVYATEIKGNITLPMSQLFDVDVDVTVVTSQTNGSITSVTERFTVISGDTTSIFSVDVVDPIAAEHFIVSYECKTNCSSLVQEGFYNSSGLVFNSIEAERIDPFSNLNGINLDLMSGATIEGDLYLPLGFGSATQPVTVAIDVLNEDTNSVYASTTSETSIASGNTFVSYSVAGVPKISSNPQLDDKYVVQYRCLTGCSGVLKSAYYNDFLSAPRFRDALGISSDQSFIDGIIMVMLMDSDDDNVQDNLDNCPHDSNTSQANFDKDSLGDVCDPDKDNDNVMDPPSGSDPDPFNDKICGDMDMDNIDDCFVDESLCWAIVTKKGRAVTICL